MLQGAFKHRDFKGHAGVIHAGDLQWMTAGRGIVHSEMPAGGGPGGELGVGLQLWVNLSHSDKLCEPRYQELRARDIPTVEKDGVWCKVIAGDAMGTKASVRTKTPTSYLHYKLQPNAIVKQPIPEGWTVFSYVLNGEVTFGSPEHNKSAEAHCTVVFSKGDTVIAQNKLDSESEFVLIYGQPTGEPIVQHGPFVMTSEEEITEAINDFREQRNGFEGAQNWSG